MVATEKPKASVADIRKWLETKPHYPQTIPDDLLLIFLHSCYYIEAKTIRAIEAYFRIRSSTPEFFNNRCIVNSDMITISENIKTFALPGRTKEGYVVISSMLSTDDYSRFSLENAVKLLFMVIDLCLKEQTPPIPGFLFTFNMTDMCFGHLTKISISTVRKYFNYIQEAMPVRLKGIHIVHVNSVMSHVMSLIRPFTYKEHMNQIHLYRTSEIDKMYDHIPLEMLPKDQGGNSPTSETLFNETLEKLKSLEPYFDEDEATLRIDESKREPSETNNGFMKSIFGRWAS
ncbi:retinaldehyde-binding protein 1 [Nilaparvata lugens]|uniref:retinaldehyde-binding protein 1 n=1 Tax=Nilaparvata lugens TaxID=108931 RepID=UPI00193D76BF|nr:retinaldehyde-binding protein 1 [Nilaparvata lugens]